MRKKRITNEMIENKRLTEMLHKSTGLHGKVVFIDHSLYFITLEAIINQSSKKKLIGHTIKQAEKWIEKHWEPTSERF